MGRDAGRRHDRLEALFAMNTRGLRSVRFGDLKINETATQDRCAQCVRCALCYLGLDLPCDSFRDRNDPTAPHGRNTISLRWRDHVCDCAHPRRATNDPRRLEDRADRGRVPFSRR